MTIHYQKLYPREGSDDCNSKDGNKIGLSAFNGVCFKCGKTGHKANNCHQKNANGVPNKFVAGGKGGNSHKNLQCHGCGKTGHITKNGWERNPMCTSDHQDGNHPKKLELSALMLEVTTRLNSFCADCR
jgi:hypothetical protein